jgi:hypothetical protein
VLSCAFVTIVFVFNSVVLGAGRGPGGRDRSWCRTLGSRWSRVDVGVDIGVGVGVGVTLGVAVGLALGVGVAPGIISDKGRC